MIKCFTFENFKSFEKAELNVETLTTLIGANSSGKSNAIEGIAILAMAATGMELRAILDGTVNAGSLIRGGSHGCARFRTSAFRLGCLIGWDEEGDLLYEMKVRVNGQVAIEEEGLYFVKSSTLEPGNDKIFKTRAAKRDETEIKVQYKNGSMGRDSEITCVRSTAILPQMTGKTARETKEERAIVSMMETVVNHLKNIRILNPIPSEIRNYARISDVELRMNCDNLSAVLHKMCQKAHNKKLLLDIIRNLSENDVTDLEFIETKIGDVIFALKEKSNHTVNRVDARQLSDGTLRCIAALTALLMSEAGSMVLIEEIDNGIHPARVYRLIDQLMRVGRERRTDIVITTHNAALMNSYTKDDLLGVSVVYREKEKGTGKIIPFVDIENFPSMLAAGGLGDAMVDESLVDSLKQERHKKDYSWLGV